MDTVYRLRLFSGVYLPNGEEACVEIFLDNYERAASIAKEFVEQGIKISIECEEIA